MAEVSLLKAPYAPSLTHEAFLKSRKKVKLLAGPVGGGKTTVACVDLWTRALRMPPDKHGRRMSKILMARSTATKAAQTTLRTWMDWIPSDFLVAQKLSPPYNLRYEAPLPDGTTFHLTVEVDGLDPINGLSKLKSSEYTFIYFNEADQGCKEVIEAILSCSRLRYPKVADAKLPKAWTNENGALLPEYMDENGFLLPEYERQVNVAPESGVILDFNLTHKEHFIYEKVHSLDDENEQYFEQPAAMLCLNFDEVESKGAKPELILNPMAENLTKLPEGYYENQAKKLSWSQVKRDILMEWSSVEDGVRVHPEFKRAVHVSKTLEVVEGAYTIVGFDTSGYNPAAVIGQVVGGSIFITDTLYEPDTSLNEFISSMLLPLLNRRYKQCPIYAVCDPSGQRGINDLKPYMLLQSFGVDAGIAPTNSIDDRIAAVAKLHTRVDGVRIGEKERLLIEGLESSYVFEKLKNGVGYRAVPDKKCVAGHLCDAYQYLALQVTTFGDSTNRRKIIRKRERFI